MGDPAEGRGLQNIARGWVPLSPVPHGPIELAASKRVHRGTLPPASSRLDRHKSMMRIVQQVDIVPEPGTQRLKELGNVIEVLLG